VALFNISVQSWLNLPESVRLAIVKTAVDTGRIASALETLVAKIDEANEVPAALHDVSSAPCIAPTFSGPKISARNAGMVAKPPPYIVNTANRLAWNIVQLPLAASRGISRNRTNCATKKIV